MIFFIELIFGITLLYLIGKATLDTTWGTCLLIFGIICHALAFILSTTAWTLGSLKRLTKLWKTEREKSSQNNSESLRIPRYKPLSRQTLKRNTSQPVAKQK